MKPDGTDQALILRGSDTYAQWHLRTQYTNGTARQYRARAASLGLRIRYARTTGHMVHMPSPLLPQPLCPLQVMQLYVHFLRCPQVGWELIVANVGDSLAYLDTGSEIVVVSKREGRGC